MLLTIGMIVKNEEKYLRQCLEAIKPILDSISSELIIVDTGSTDRTVEIAKEFTDKVYFFEWINDFSAARNFGLEKAQGEWFMTVDGDEIFISCDDIINFFKSGEYKQFNSACYTQRNYSDPERKGRYIDSYVPRMTKLLPETRYVNAIHECLNTHGQPVRLLADVVDHYGYIQSVTVEKAKRNIELLHKRIETDGESPMVYRELFDAMIIGKEDEEEAYKCLERGIALCNEYKSDYILALYVCGIANRFSSGKYEKAIEMYEEYFSIDKEIKNEVRNTDLDILAFAGLSFCRLKRYDEACKTMQRYFELYDYIERTNLRTRDMLYSYRCLADEKACRDIHIEYCTCCLETDRLKEVENSLKKYPASLYKEKFYTERVRQGRLLAERYDADTFAEKLTKSDAKLQNELFTAFRSLVFGMDAEKRNTIIKKLDTANLKSAAQRKLVAVYKGHFLGKGAGDALLIEYADKFGMDYPDLFIIMNEECMNALSYLSKCDDIEVFVGTGLRAVDGFRETMARLNYENVARGDIYNSVKTCLGVIIGLLKEGISASFLYGTVGNLGIRYLESFGERDIPAEIMAAVTIAEINLFRSGRNFRGCLDALRRLVQLDKKYAQVVIDYQNLIKADMGSIK